MNPQVIFLGTEIKLRVEMKPIEDILMGDCDFILEAYVENNKNKIIIKKEGEYQDKAVIVTEDNKACVFLIDTSKLGVGNLKCKITLFVPDPDFNDNKRTEVSILNPNIIIKDEKMR